MALSKGPLPSSLSRSDSLLLTRVASATRHQRLAAKTPPTPVSCAYSGGDVSRIGQQRGSTAFPGSGNVSSGPYLPFRRPPAPGAENLSVEELLEILRERRGPWFQLAPHVTSLLNQGLSPSLIGEITGIEGGEQTILVVGAQVYNTLKESGCAVLSYFDAGGAELLYELRVLGGDRRREAAEYIAQERLDGKGAREVARAMKEYERRKKEEGHSAFSPSPADCLAYMLYRQSKEVKAVADKVAALGKALSFVSSEFATQKLKDELERVVSPQPDSGAADASLARVPVVRLRSDELFPTPIPVLGELQGLSAVELTQAAAGIRLNRLGGAFETFSPGAGSVWMAVPRWPALAAVSGRLAGILVEDLDAVPSLKGKNVSGPLVLVVEVGGGGDSTSGGLVLAQKDGKLVLVSSSSEVEQLGKVVLALLPPAPEAEADESNLDD